MTWEHVEHVSTTLSVVNTLGALGCQSWAVSLHRRLARLKPQTTAMQAPPATERPCHHHGLRCGDACPYFPGKTYLDWQLGDPAGQGVEAVRPIRDEIKTLIEDLIAEIDAKKA
ncbi:hypothetical protein [Streptomyces sp. ISL-44]|uniref:hypothetical protein n=1 Tax=Streptomyces sp. ISL-44 TaxID=2819184 RepID=UPI00203635B8|nr:hypothetical protein [Streptomyces sp. ISL-44]